MRGLIIVWHWRCRLRHCCSQIVRLLRVHRFNNNRRVIFGQVNSEDLCGQDGQAEQQGKQQRSKFFEHGKIFLSFYFVFSITPMTRVVYCHLTQFLIASCVSPPTAPAKKHLPEHESGRIMSSSQEQREGGSPCPINFPARITSAGRPGTPRPASVCSSTGACTLSLQEGNEYAASSAFPAGTTIPICRSLPPLTAT